MNNKRKNYVGGEGIPVVWQYPHTACDINPYLITLKKRRRENTDDAMKNKNRIQINAIESKEEFDTDINKEDNEARKICFKTLCDKHRSIAAKRCRHLLDTPCNSMGEFEGYYPDEEICSKEGHNASLMHGRCSNYLDHERNFQHVLRNQGLQPDYGNQQVKKEPNNTMPCQLNCKAPCNKCREKERNSDIYQCFQGLSKEIRKLRHEVKRLSNFLAPKKMFCTCNCIKENEPSTLYNSYNTGQELRQPGIK